MAIFQLTIYFPFVEALLDQLRKPDDYSGPPIEIILKDSKADNLSEFVDNMLTSNLRSGDRVGMFQKNEEVDGDLSKILIERVNANKFQLTEMQEFMDRVNKTKIYEEIQNLRIAGSFTEWSFRKLIKELEENM